jgi:hypothetical protein
MQLNIHHHSTPLERTTFILFIYLFIYLLKKYNCTIIIKHLHVYKCSHGLVQGVRPVHTFIQAFIFVYDTVAFGSLHRMVRADDE